MKSQVVEPVLEQDLTDLRRTKRFIHSSLRIAVMVAHDFFQHLVKLQAMALSFKTLLSLAPLLAVIFSLLKGFGVHNRMEPALAEALEPLGEKGREITANLISFVDKMSAGALGSVGLIALLLTVLSLMDTIEEAFNHIWRVKS
jgi:membrane protein